MQKLSRDVLLPPPFPPVGQAVCDLHLARHRQQLGDLQLTEGAPMLAAKSLGAVPSLQEESAPRQTAEPPPRHASTLSLTAGKSLVLNSCRCRSER